MFVLNYNNIIYNLIEFVIYIFYILQRAFSEIELSAPSYDFYIYDGVHILKLKFLFFKKITLKFQNHV